MSAPNDFFTMESLTTFGGAVAATVIVPNAFQRGFNWNPRWLALVLAWAICFGVVIAGQVPGTPTPPTAYIVAFINGCLVFCSAVGATAVGSSVTQPAPLPEKAGPDTATAATGGAGSAWPRKRGFFSPWF